MRHLHPQQLEFEFETKPDVTSAVVVDIKDRLRAKRAKQSALLRAAILSRVDHLTDPNLDRIYK